MRYAEVMMDIAHANVDRCFTYIVPEDMPISAGSRVLAPFGRGDKPVEGFVVSMTGVPRTQDGRITYKELLRTLENYPVMRQDQLELAQWMSVQYHSLLVEALRLMIPAQLRGGRIKEKRVKTVRLLLAGEALEEFRASLFAANGVCRAPLQLGALDLLAEVAAEMALGDITGHLPGAAGAINALAKKGVVAVSEANVFRTPYARLETLGTPDFTLSDAQQAALTQIIGALQSRAGCFLLHGVTGSGKTEIYLRAIAQCLALGRSAIMLVPEISLTPQMVERFRSRFGGEVAVLHSRLSSGERFDEWRRIRLGGVKVVVGARSAVFAPFERIGLIVIDEEHESTYSAENSPRYSAREVARKRCEQHGAALVLGSATPSLETYQAMREGQYELIELPSRIADRPLPEVQVVDMREEMMRGNRSIFSMPLYREMKRCFHEGHQMILFLNRRGYSTFISCRGCGFVLSCENCDISLTYHKAENIAKCHYCGFQAQVPSVCPECGKPYLKYFGVGTQQVEEQVKKYFPAIPVLRMDYDTTQAKDAHLDILQAFRRREAQVLIGTQMIAKGLDFPEVTLVGVIAADATLHIPDYRSAERAFQLITQVAGRAGRDRSPGTVIVQTYSPKHPSVAHAANHDYASFFNEEIEARKRSEFPPFAVFVRILFAGADETGVSGMASRCHEALESALQAHMAEKKLDQDTLLYVCHAPAPLKRIQDVIRYQVVAKLRVNAHTDELIAAIYAYADANKKDSPMRLEINPQNML